MLFCKNNLIHEADIKFIELQIEHLPLPVVLVTEELQVLQVSTVLMRNFDTYFESIQDVSTYIFRLPKNCKESIITSEKFEIICTQL